jgi:hypothetical protein
LETRQEENPSPKTKSEPKRTGETIRKKVNSKIDGLISLDRKKKSPGREKKKSSDRISADRISAGIKFHVTEFFSPISSKCAV